VLGLKVGWSSEHAHAALRAIYRYNFKNTFYEHPNTQRVCALNDDKGLLLCSWPKWGRPSLPFVYSDEVWTGIEFQVAAHLIYEGMLEEGLSIVRSICDRYDGLRRNPWNEVECGSHYARALASWSVLLALCGYTYSANDLSIGFMPKINFENFKCFFAAGSGWGTYIQHVGKLESEVRLEVLHGEVRFRRLKLRNDFAAAAVAVSGLRGFGDSLKGVQLRATQEALQIDFGSQVAIPAGQALTLILSAH
jgi:hypothetical protein